MDKNEDRDDVQQEAAAEAAAEGAHSEGKEAELAFEQALERLETIVRELEGGRLPVDEMMQKFEEGMKLADFCNKRLDDIRGKIEILVKKAGGTVEWEEVDPGQLA